MNSERIDLFQFADTALSSTVQAGLHAVSVDEQRADFSPTLWNLDPGRIVQMVFPGAHADVGGGYPQGAESGLSDGSLQWMCEQLAGQGVLFRPTPLPGLAPNPLGPAHQPWTEPIWQHAPHALRNTLQGLPPHTSFAASWLHPRQARRQAATPRPTCSVEARPLRTAAQANPQPVGTRHWRRSLTTTTDRLARPLRMSGFCGCPAFARGPPSHMARPLHIAWLTSPFAAADRPVMCRLDNCCLP